MNLLLLTEQDFEPDGTARVSGRRALHAHQTLKAVPGATLRVGKLNGNTGTGEVLLSSPSELRLRVTLDRAPPPRAGIDLLLAIPRPKALKKILPAVASLGVGTVVLINAARVEKSYFQADVLERARIDDLLSQGLEQAGDTQPPRVEIRERFRPCVEDELDGLFGEARRLLPHPSAPRPLAELSPLPPGRRAVLAIGPEGGWVPFETELLERRGFEPFTLGPRILRVEVCVAMLIGSMRVLLRSTR